MKNSQMLVVFFAITMSVFLTGCETIMPGEIKTFSVKSDVSNVVYVDAYVSKDGKKVIAPSRVIVDVSNFSRQDHFVDFKLGSRVLYEGIKFGDTITFKLPESPFSNGQAHLIAILYRVVDGKKEIISVNEDNMPSSGPVTGRFTAANGYLNFNYRIHDYSPWGM